MKPGDIVLMTPQPTADDAGLLTRMGANVFGAVSGAIQGKYTHAGIYAGNGKVIDIRAETGVRKVPLKELTKDLSVAVVRPNVHARIRRQAVQKAEGYYTNRDQIKYHVPDLIPAAASAFLDIGEKPINENQVICSSMVANAFGKHKIAPGVARHATKPVDFLKSPRVKYVGDFDVKKESALKTIGLNPGDISPHVDIAAHVARQSGVTVDPSLVDYYKNMHARAPAAPPPSLPAASLMSPEQLQAHLRLRTQQRGAQQLAAAVPISARPQVAPPPMLGGGTPVPHATFRPGTLTPAVTGAAAHTTPSALTSRIRAALMRAPKL